MMAYISRYVIGIMPRRSQFYSEVRKTLYGEGGNSNCAIVVSAVFPGDLHGKIQTLQVLTYDLVDSMPADDSRKINAQEGSETCADHSPNCDSHVRWARWYNPGTDKDGIVTVTTKDGKAASLVVLVFKNWSSDRVRGAQINLTVN